MMWRGPGWMPGPRWFWGVGGGLAFDFRHRPRPRADVLGGRPDELRFALLLEDVRRPARDARAGEQRGEQVRRDFGHVEHDRRPELDVGREHTVGAAGLQLGERGPL